MLRAFQTNAPENTATADDDTMPTAYVFARADGTTPITFLPAVLPDMAEVLGRTFWQVRQGDGVIQAHDFAAQAATVLPAGAPREFVVQAGFDDDNDGWLGSTEIERRIRLIVVPPVEVEISTFIKQEYVDDPVPFSTSIFNGNDRMFQHGSASYKTRQSVNVIASGDSDGIANPFNDTGTTIEYHKPSSVDPQDHITAAAHADTVLGDANMKIATAKAGTGDMHITGEKAGTRTVLVVFDMSASNPLAPPGSPAITYKFTLEITYGINPSFSPVYFFRGTHDAFPCYEVYLNGQAIYRHDSGNNTVLSLTGANSVTVPSTAGVIP